MNLDLESLELNDEARAALMRVLQVEPPAVAAQRAKLHRVQTAPVIDTASPDKTKFQIVYRNDMVGKVTVQNQLSGIELHDPATGDVATMNLRIGLNYLDQRFFDSFEAEREVRKLVALGAITVSPPGLHVGVESFPPAVIEHFAYVAWHYAKSEKSMRALVPFMPPGKDRKLLTEYLAAIEKERAAEAAEQGLEYSAAPSQPIVGENAAGALGLEMSIGARAELPAA